MEKQYKTKMQAIETLTVTVFRIKNEDARCGKEMMPDAAKETSYEAIEMPDAAKEMMPDEAKEKLYQAIEMPKQAIEMPYEAKEMPYEATYEAKEMPNKAIGMPYEAIEMPKEAIEMPQEAKEMPYEATEMHMRQWSLETSQGTIVMPCEATDWWQKRQCHHAILTNSLSFPFVLNNIFIVYFPLLLARF